MKAKWELVTQPDGSIAVVYRNLLKGIDFECGICSPGTPLDLIIQFIEEEGDFGDHVFHDGEWLTHLIAPALA